MATRESEPEVWEELMPGVRLKKVELTGTNENPMPEFRQWAQFSWSGFVTSSWAQFAPARLAWVKIGDGECSPGLELGLRSLRVGEKGTIECEPRFAFGSSGRPAAREGDMAVDANTAVSFVVEIKALGTESMDPSALAPPERIVEGERKRQSGNENCTYADYERAARCYGAALKAVDGLLGVLEEKEALETVARLIIDCGNNLAFTYIKLGNHAKAEAACISVLQGDPSNPKALYRAGVAAMHQTKFVEARLALQKLLALEPENVSCKTQLRELARREKKYKEKEKKVASRMSAAMFGDDASGHAESKEPAAIATGVRDDQQGSETNEGALPQGTTEAAPAGDLPQGTTESKGAVWPQRWYIAGAALVAALAWGLSWA